MNESGKRKINQNGIKMPFYYFNFFKAPGLDSYPNWSWINDDYELIKTKKITLSDINRIANNFYYTGNKFKLFSHFDYVIIMPLKPSSFSNLERIVETLMTIINKNIPTNTLKLLKDVFFVYDYQPFWRNRLKVKERKIAIKNKIILKTEFYGFFNNKKILIIDDVVSSGISIASVAKQLLKYNTNLELASLCYGSVYQWEKIYL